MDVRAEFTTEPFHGEDGHPPAHVTSAADALVAAGLEPDLGPLGTAVAGDSEQVVDGVAAALRAALAHGATRITLTLADVRAEPDQPAQPKQPKGARGQHPAPAASARTEATDLTDGLARLIADVEGELGGPLAGLSRPEKQHAVRLLEERGAFEMRRSAETVAEAMGLTRFTVYNYLNRLREASSTG